MDHLSDDFGRLSTSAREWTPGGSSSQNQSHPRPPQVERTGSQDWQAEDSELNAEAVKEFVPGKGWSTQTKAAPAAQQQSRQQQQQPGESIS
jgi:hypothetical protein